MLLIVAQKFSLNFLFKSQNETDYSNYLYKYLRLSLKAFAVVVTKVI